MINFAKTGTHSDRKPQIDSRKRLCRVKRLCLVSVMSLLGLGCVLVAPSLGQANEGSQLQTELDERCKAIADFLGGGKVCTMGQFRTRGSSMGIAEIIRERLVHHGVKVVSFDEKYEVAIQGLVKFLPNADNIEELAIEIELVDDNFTTLHRFDGTYSLPGGGEIVAKEGKVIAKTHNVEEIAIHAAIPVDFGRPKARLKTPQYQIEQKNKLKDAYETPTQKLVNPHEVVHQNTEYGLEILVNKTPRALDFSDSKFPRCLLTQEEKFIVRLHNHTAHEAAVFLTLDGLSSFQFSEDRGSDGRPKSQHWIIPANRHVDVPGWYVDPKVVREFTITGFEGSALKKAKQVAGEHAGFIAAAFKVSWPVDQPAPSFAGEGYSTDAADTFVGLGDEIHFKSKTQPRHFSDVRQTLVISYRQQK